MKVVRPFGLFHPGGVFAEYDGEVMVGAVAVPVQGFCPPNVAVGDFFANVSGAGVECEPNGFGGISTEFDEMVATAQGAALADGGLFACGHVDAEVGEAPEVAGESLVDELVGFQNGGTGGVVVGADRYRGFPCGPEWGKVVGKIAGGEVGADGHHAAANVAADGCGGYCVAHGDDAANGDGGAHMHVGHDGHPVGPGQVGDRPDLALCRMIDVDEWRPNAGGRASTGEGFGQVEGMMHDETPCVRTTRLVHATTRGWGVLVGWSVGQLHGSLLTCLLVTVAVRRGECNLVVLVQLPHRVFGCGNQAAVHDERHDFGDFGG